MAIDQIQVLYTKQKYNIHTHNFQAKVYILFHNVFILIDTAICFKFIHNTVGQYVHMHTKLHTCTINKHTYQGQYRIKYLHKYRSKLRYFMS